MVLYGPWENTAYPMFMHWSVSLGWLWNCNAVNQKASFLCTLYIYIYLYIVTVWYLAKCMTRRHFFPLNIFIFILHANRFYLYRWCMFKKNHDPPPTAWSIRKAMTPPLSISNFFTTNFIVFGLTLPHSRRAR